MCFVERFWEMFLERSLLIVNFNVTVISEAKTRIGEYAYKKYSINSYFIIFFG